MQTNNLVARKVAVSHTSLRGSRSHSGWMTRCGSPISRRFFVSGLFTFLLGTAITGCGSATVQMGSGPEEAKSALFVAIEGGDIEAVHAELSRDPSLLNQPEGGFGQTPLHKAVRSNQFEIVRYLVENGAEVNLFDNLSRTPLAAAIDTEAAPEIVQILEDFGAVD